MEDVHTNKRRRILSVHIPPPDAVTMEEDEEPKIEKSYTLNLIRGQDEHGNVKWIPIRASKISKTNQ